MSEDMKEETNATPPEVKEDDSSKVEEKTADDSSKDSDKNDVEKNIKEDVESGKEESGKEESEEEDDDDDEEAMGLLDRPVEVTGCRARKKVERLEVSFATPKDKEMEIPEGNGQKLGQCPRIEFQIQKCKVVDMKPLHKILFNRVGAEKSVKRNIRKFSGFPFDKNSDEYNKKLYMLNKCNNSVLRRICLILDLDRGGSKENLTDRILEFLLSPKDSGKKVPSKKSKSTSGKKKQKKTKTKQSDDEAESADDAVDESDESADEIDSEEGKSDDEPKKKSKTTSKSSASKDKTKKPAVKSKKEEKKTTAKTAKRKRDVDEEDESSDDDKPLAKKGKMPSDDEIKKMIKGILDSADLQEITMKKVINQVSEAYPDFDLTHKKAFIKTTVKSLLNV